jgi:hypothetical protein
LPSGAGEAGMRSVNLLKVAAEAEVLRYPVWSPARDPRRVRCRGRAVRAGCARAWRSRRMACPVLAFRSDRDHAHFAWHQSRHRDRFLLLAARSSSSLTEREALRVRQPSLEAARGAHSLAALIPVGARSQITVAAKLCRGTVSSMSDLPVMEPQLV